MLGLGSRSLDDRLDQSRAGNGAICDDEQIEHEFGPFLRAMRAGGFRQLPLSRSGHGSGSSVERPHSPSAAPSPGRCPATPIADPAPASVTPAPGSALFGRAYPKSPTVAANVPYVQPALLSRPRQRGASRQLD